MAYKQKSPFKILGGITRAVGGLFGGGKGGGGKMTPGMMAGGVLGGPLGMMAMMKKGVTTGGSQPGQFDMQAVKQGGSALSKKIGFTPYTKPKSKSPFKTDAILVKGAGKAASANDTAKYAIIAKSRAFSDMVNSVEKTVNRSAAAQLKKDRDRAKKTVRSSHKYGDWKENFDARKDLQTQRKRGRREAANKRRASLGMRTKNWSEYDEYDPTADHGGTNTQGLYPYNYD